MFSLLLWGQAVAKTVTQGIVFLKLEKGLARA